MIRTIKAIFCAGVACLFMGTSANPLWAQRAGFVYVANGFSGNISAYMIDGPTGALTAVPGSPFVGGVNPVSITVDPTGRFVYVTNRGTFFTGNNIAGYRIEGLTGALTPIPGSPFLSPEGIIPLAVAVDPTGRFLYTTILLPFTHSSMVAAYTIDGSTGALSLVQRLNLPPQYEATSLTADSTGKFLYVASCSPPDPGQDPAQSCPRNRGAVFALAIDPDTGSLALVQDSPFPAEINPRSIAASPTGPFVYVANFSSNSVSAYSIDENTGALIPVPGSPFLTSGSSSGSSPHAVTVDPGGQFVYLGTDGGDVPAYAVDTTTGALTPVLGSPFPAHHFSFSLAVQVDPSGQFVYTSNTRPNCSQLECFGQVSAFKIDRQTGALSPVPGSPFPENGGIGPRSIAVTRGP